MKPQKAGDAMRTDYRQSDFKLEQIHGRHPAESCREARIRNYLFGVRVLLVNHTRDEQTRIRIVGYEVPIYARGKKRDQCIDLVGYDARFRPWIIELKKAESSEPPEQAVLQVNRYARAFEEGIRGPLQNEICERMLWAAFEFEGPPMRMVLADRSLYAEPTWHAADAEGIVFCSFAGYDDEGSLMRSPRAAVKLKIQKVASS
jgi:hypothetical protein